MDMYKSRERIKGRIQYIYRKKEVLALPYDRCEVGQAKDIGSVAVLTKIPVRWSRK
jgi:hypothetical protein